MQIRGCVDQGISGLFSAAAVMCKGSVRIKKRCLCIHGAWVKNGRCVALLMTHLGPFLAIKLLDLEVVAAGAVPSHRPPLPQPVPCHPPRGLHCSRQISGPSWHLCTVQLQAVYHRQKYRITCHCLEFIWTSMPQVGVGVERPLCLDFVGQSQELLTCLQCLLKVFFRDSVTCKAFESSVKAH